MKEAKVLAVLAAAKDSRYLEAERILMELDRNVPSIQLLKFLLEGDASKFSGASTALGDLESVLISNRLGLKEVLNRAAEIKNAVQLQLFFGEETSEWKLGASYCGIDTYFKVENGLINVRMEGGLSDLPLFEQCAVIHEVDLFKEWMPFCNDSALLEKFGPAELVMYLSISALFLSRDTCMHAWGADCLHETGLILLFGRSVLHTHSKNQKEDECHQSLLQKDDITSQVVGIETFSQKHACPWKEESWSHKKMEVVDFKAIFKPTSENTATTVIMACINPNVPLHQGLVNFVIKKMAGLALYFFQKRVSMVAHSEESSTSSKIQENVHFYTDWLLPKVRQYYYKKGWEMGNLPCLRSLGTEVESASNQGHHDESYQVEE